MYRILFVDDEPRILTGLRRMLRGQRHEWEMEFAEGGAEALEVLRTAPFDVVVSDARMPLMEGSQLLEIVRHEFPDTVRMILSGQCSRSSVMRCVGVAHQFHSKPCDSESLKASIRQVCYHRAQVQDEATRAAVSQVESLPSALRPYVDLTDSVAADPPSPRRTSDATTSDVALSLKLLQLVSSGFFGTPKRAIDVSGATDLLGVEAIRSLASLPNVFRLASPGEIDDESLAEINRHSLAVASAAKAVAESATHDRQVIVESQLAGLFHEVGVLIRTTSGSTPESVTHDDGVGKGAVSPVGSQQAGGYLAALWGLPSEVARAVENHRSPFNADEGAFTPLTAVHVAHACCENRRHSHNEGTSEADIDYLKAVGYADRLNQWREMCHAVELGEVLQ